MPIADKTRKILWGRSGNRCAICRITLVIDATTSNDGSVIGDECHIVSGKSHGPRHDPEFPTDRLNDPENLILLCRVHHKMVDDQHETYPVHLLQEIKRNHEGWVSVALASERQPPPLRLRRIKDSIPTCLVRLTTGRDIMKIVNDAGAFSFDHDESRSEEEMELISEFLQDAHDWGELSSGLESSEWVRAAFRMSSLLQSLAKAGFWVFGGREVQRLEGGCLPASVFPVALIRIIRSTNPDVISINPNDYVKEGESQGLKDSVPEADETYL